MAHLLKALNLNPNLAQAHNIVGILLANKGRSDEAMAHLLKALEINPNNGDARYNLDLLRAQMGRSK
jgi:tetratricopeptide (TPR) repeat protein